MTTMNVNQQTCEPVHLLSEYKDTFEGIIKARPCIVAVVHYLRQEPLPFSTGMDWENSYTEFECVLLDPITKLYSAELTNLMSKSDEERFLTAYELMLEQISDY